MTTRPIDYDALRELAEKATPGPWEAFGTTVAAWGDTGDCGGCSGILSPAHEPSCYLSEIAGAGAEDAAFIAAARTAVPELLDALQAAEHRASRAEAQSETRRINTEYWRGVARGNAICSDVWKESAEEAQARIKAVEDVLDEWEARGLTAPPDIRRALTA